jgi:S-methylmethionine-dependent homocysteine/selenocysteine methylase
MYYLLIQISISFTVETDGNLPNGQSLKEAIEEIDERTNQGPIYYLINCAHPTHFNSNLGKKNFSINL